MPEPIRFLALDREYAESRAEVARRFERVLESQSFVMGAETAELESSMRTLTGARHAVACSSGSAALYLALRALDVKAGSAVLVPAYTFIATAEAVANTGAVPVFTDVAAETLDIGAAEIEATVEREFRVDGGVAVHRASGARLAAAVAVHLFGRACRMREITDTAERFGFRIVEDAAQAIGAAGDGGPVGGWGAAACFSFYPTKNLGGAGDGGIVTTGDPGLAARVARLRVHGADESPLHRELGINARMGELQAAYLNAKWPRLAEWNRARDRLATHYGRLLADLTADGRLGLLAQASLPAHIHHQFAVRVPAALRDRVRERLRDDGIETRVFYPVALHRQPCFIRDTEAPVRLAVAEAAAGEILCLPIHPFLELRDVERVSESLQRALAS